MIGLYVICLIPMVIGAIIMKYNHKIALQEWGIGSAAGLLITVIIHISAVAGMQRDVQLYSGEIIEAKHYSAWLEYYEYAVYRTEVYTETVSDGRGGTTTETRTREVFDHWEPTERWHNEYWEWYSNIDTSYSIDKATFDDVVKNFKSKNPVPGARSTWEHNSRMISGDPNDYSSTNNTGYIYPVNDERSWSNKIKACPSVFSFAEVPENVKVYQWGITNHPYISWRVMGKANEVITVREWDNFCAKIGPIKKINPIIIGFGDESEMIAEWQRAKWIGGKKNDLVICYGGDNKKPDWCKVFGWSDSNICKQNIQSHIMKNGVSKDLITYLHNELIDNYEIKDWKEFDYLQIDIPVFYYVLLVILLTATQTGLYFFFHYNDFDKDSRW